MPADHLDLADHGLGRAAGLKALHEQRRSWRSAAGIVALVAERQHDQQLTVALGQVSVQGLQHARRQTRIPRPRVDQLLVPGQHSLEQDAHALDQAGAPFDDVGAADGRDGGAATAAQGDADPVAGDQPPRLVSDGIGYLGRVQTGMDGAREGFKVRPETLPAHHLQPLAVARVSPCEPCHADEELEQDGHAGLRAVGVLQHFDKADHLAVHNHRRHEDHIVGRIARSRFPARSFPRTALRRQVHGAGLSEGLAEEFVMAFAVGGAVLEAHLPHVDLIEELDRALASAPPDGPGVRRQHEQQPLEKFRIVFRRHQVHFR